MLRGAIKARREVSRRVGFGIVALSLVGVLIIIAIAVLFMALVERQSDVARRIREDALWAAYQTDREASRLLEETLAGDLDKIRFRFDLLYSRVALIDAGQYQINFGADSEVGRSAAAAAAAVQALEPHVETLTPPDLAAFSNLVRQARGATGALVVAVNAAMNAVRVEERAIAHQTYLELGLAVAMLAIVLVAMVLLLAFQLIHISRTGRELTLMSARNARVADMAEAASRAKSAFLATMSHEIRTPLNGIIGNLDLLESAALSAEQRSYVMSIRRSGDVLLDVISDVLDFSKLESGAIKIDPAPYHLRQLQGTLWEILSPRARLAGLALEIDLPDACVTLDAGRLRQVLVNLIGNAIKFTPQGSVRVRGRIVGDLLHVDVLDTGIGISEDAQSLLFRDFSQVDSSNTRVHGGSGLGLAICRRLIEAMGGDIGVESQVAAGSRFWIAVPAPLLVSPDPLVNETPMAAPLPSELRGRVLLVEDNEINRQVAGGLLKRLGLDVEYADNGQLALDRVTANPPDVILMDMQMPVMDGLDATRSLRAQGCQLPIIGLTANAFVTDEAACLAAGMNAFLSKPVTRNKLASTLSQWLPGGGRGLGSAPALGIDTTQQAMLREELGEDTFAALQRKFGEDARQLVDEAVAANKRHDQQGWFRALHTLKGAAASIGYVGLMDGVSQLSKSGSQDEERLRALLRASLNSPESDTQPGGITALGPREPGSVPAIASSLID